MNEHQIKSNHSIVGWGESRPTATVIPSRYIEDLSLRLEVKSQPFSPMNSNEIPENSLIPTLFQIASRAEDAESIRALKHALVSGGKPLAEVMLNTKRLEGILKALGKKKKSGIRRARPERRLSLDGGAIA
jgi:hypothetical protein